MKVASDERGPESERIARVQYPVVLRGQEGQKESPSFSTGKARDSKGCATFSSIEDAAYVF